MEYNDSMASSFSFPPDVVPGSQRAHVAVVGMSAVVLPALPMVVPFECRLCLRLVN